MYVAPERYRFEIYQETKYLQKVKELTKSGIRKRIERLKKKKNFMKLTSILKN